MSPNKRKLASKKKNTKQRKNNSSNYITVNGQRYERVSNKSVEVELELADDVLRKIDASVKAGRYISRGDAIRHILRTIIESKEPIE